MVAALAVIDGDRTALALELPAELQFDEWVKIGRRLFASSQVINWHIGDWWAFGDHRYGDRAKAAAEGIFGREFQTLANLASVSRKFEAYRRREVLSFTHHAEVAALPPETADHLLSRAESEHLSKNDLRREVQALKAANEPGTADDRQAVSSAPSVQATFPRSAVNRAYEMVIELTEAIERDRTLTRREQDMLSEALEFVSETTSAREAKPGGRKCPAEFDVIFVEQGRLACESYFGASRVMVNHWLIERGKRRLLDQRAAFVRHEREHGRKESSAKQDATAEFALDEMAREAAQFMRISRYGGYRVSPTGDGDWFVGTVRKTSDELIAMAERQGFDSEAARAGIANEE